MPNGVAGCLQADRRDAPSQNICGLGLGFSFPHIGRIRIPISADRPVADKFLLSTEPVFVSGPFACITPIQPVAVSKACDRAALGR